MKDPQFKPGFIISTLDIVVVVCGAAGAALAGMVEWWMGLIIAFAVGNFFLFCNVFRVERVLELCWATLFIALAGCTIVIGTPIWPVTFMFMAGATVLVIGMQMRRRSYHGIGWRRINPKLPQWWEEKSRTVLGNNHSVR